MSIAGMHSVGMRRCTLTLCPSPAHESGATGGARGRSTAGAPVFAREFYPPLNPARRGLSRSSCVQPAPLKR